MISQSGSPLGPAHTYLGPGPCLYLHPHPSGPTSSSYSAPAGMGAYSPADNHFLGIMLPLCVRVLMRRCIAIGCPVTCACT